MRRATGSNKFTAMLYALLPVTGLANGGQSHRKAVVHSVVYALLPVTTFRIAS